MMSGYDPSDDPNWQYQGRTPKQVEGGQKIVAIAMLALVCFLAAAVWKFAARKGIAIIIVSMVLIIIIVMMMRTTKVKIILSTGISVI